MNRLLAKAIPAHMRVPASMSGPERAYLAHLLGEKGAGRILRFDFEPSKYRIGYKAWYTPDFRVILPDCTIKLVDVKGRTKNDKYFAEEDAVVKIKAATSLHPIYRWVFTWCRRDGSWAEMEF